jgi:hypothetical protein
MEHSSNPSSSDVSPTVTIKGIVETNRRTADGTLITIKKPQLNGGLRTLIIK